MARFLWLRRCVAIAALLCVCLWWTDGARAEVVTIVLAPHCAVYDVSLSKTRGHIGISRCPNAMIDYGPFAIEGAEVDRFSRIRGGARVDLNNAHQTAAAHALLFVGILDLSALTSVLQACRWNDGCEYFICS